MSSGRMDCDTDRFMSDLARLLGANPSICSRCLVSIFVSNAVTLLAHYPDGKTADADIKAIVAALPVEVARVRAINAVNDGIGKPAGQG